MNVAQALEHANALVFPEIVYCGGFSSMDAERQKNEEALATLREEFAKNGLEGRVWQYFTIVPDFKSTGVTNGQRTYDWPVVIRAVNTVDAVTADVAELSFKMMQYIVDRITHEVPGVNRVLWDLTPKPTGTIEWE